LTFEWYIDIGPALVQTMFIAAIFPIIEFGYGYPMKIVFRWLDRRAGRKVGRETKKVTIQ
jgi:hypothetical protein